MFGAPNLSMTGNLIIFIVVIVHLYVVSWSDEVFKLFRGDVFTYGMVTKSVNFLSLIYTLSVAAFLFYTFNSKIEALSQLPYFAWGIMLLGLLGSLSIPMFSTCSVDPLPNRDERRSYEPPRTN